MATLQKRIRQFSLNTNYPVSSVRSHDQWLRLQLAVTRKKGSTRNNWTCVRHAPKQGLAIYTSMITSYEAEDYGLPDVENTLSNDPLDISTTTVIENGQ